MNSIIRAVLFDMNGVIIDDEHLHYAGTKQVFADAGAEISDRDFMEFIVGRTDKEGFILLMEKHKIDRSKLDGMVKGKEGYYADNIAGNIRTYDGVIELIEYLSGKYELALVSGAARREVEMILDHFGVRRYFNAIISGDDIIHGKPDPEPYLKAITLLGLKPENCLAIEDSLNGIRSAHNAGLKCIGITTTHSREVISIADHIFDNFQQIKIFINQK